MKRRPPAAFVVDVPRDRGRPPADRLADAFTGARGIALDVFRRELAAGRARGALADAIRAVADERRLALANVKLACARHKALRALVDIEAALDVAARDHAELVRRLRNFPPDVRAWLAPMSARAVLALLRAERINGYCPTWLAAIAHDELPPTSGRITDTKPR